VRTTVLVLCFLVFPRERVSDDPRKAIGPWTWSLVFGAFYVYLAWALVARLGLAGSAHGMAFVALIGFIAFISLPIQRFGGMGDRTSWVDWRSRPPPRRSPLLPRLLRRRVHRARRLADRAGLHDGRARHRDRYGRRNARWARCCRRRMGCSTRCSAATCRMLGHPPTRSIASSATSTSAPVTIASASSLHLRVPFVLFRILAQMTGLGRCSWTSRRSSRGALGRPGQGLRRLVEPVRHDLSSAIANAVTVALTIPMMKKYGFSPRFAAAVEASASCGGKVTPPVMGAAAFVMAEMLGVPYKFPPRRDRARAVPLLRVPDDGAP
jgi:hypothetical protein